ncbi:MAG TPA: 6-phosphogluconolactonase [Candidatus Acidoferrum sp.]|nr:6-phosphogluconolactonase [Candidatus Acidoferrum sp.]
MSSTNVPISYGDITTGEDAVYQRLSQELQDGKRVLWLLSGGSNIAREVATSRQLVGQSQAGTLTAMLMDERFGAPGHHDSNWQQLHEAGFALDVPQVLRTGELLEGVAEAYDATIRHAFAEADIIIGQFGIGADGHTAGLLPGAPVMDAATLVAGYRLPGFQRITLTPKALLQVDVAFVFAAGADKHPALEKLQNETLPLVQQSAQIFKQLREVYIYR